MKKVLLALSVVVGFGAMAQNAASDNLHPISAKDLAKLQNAQAQKQVQNVKAKAAGGPVSQRVSHTDIAVDQFGTSLQTYISPIFQDSTVMEDFGTPANVDGFGFGATFDIRTPVFSLLGQDYFADVDTYMVDTIYTAGFYEYVNSSTAGDSLIVDIVWGDPTASMFNDAYAFPAGTWTNQPTQAPLLALEWNASANHGFAGSVAWGNKITLKKALVANDTNTTYHKFWPSTPITVGPGEVIGMLLRYKSGESYSPGAIYFAGSGGTTTPTMNSFRVAISGPANQSDDNNYFMEEFSLGTKSFGMSGPQLSERYDTQFPISHTPQGTQGALFDVWVHGNSTVGLNENNVNSNVNIYPNPTNGNINLAITQGGNYQIEVVNMVGQVVSTETVSVNASETLNRDFSNLNKGIYLVNVSTDNVSNTIKLTIQ